MLRLLTTAGFCLLVGCSGAETPGSKSGPGGDTASLDTGTAPLAPFDDDLAADLQEVVEGSMSHMDAGGIIVGVALQGTEVFLGAAGTADENSGEAMATSHRLRIGSVTKTFVAAVILQLVDEGVLSLDDPVSLYVDILARGDDITIRHLLSHTSGLSEFSYAREVQEGMTSTWTDEELVSFVADTPLLSEPGTTWSYANTNYVLLGMIVEAATGQEWDEAVEDRFIGPLGLAQTHAPGPGDGWTDTVPAYVSTTDATATVHPSAVGASGAMESSAVDLLVWGEAMMGGALHSAETRAQMLADPVVVVADTVWVGLGVYQWDEAYAGEDPEIWHNGALNGYSAWLGHRVEAGETVVVLANNWPRREDGSLHFGVAQLVAEEIWARLDAVD